jgi:hypothetical protein
MKTCAGIPSFKYRLQYARAVDIFEKDHGAAVVLQRDLAEEGAAAGRKPKARFMPVRATSALAVRRMRQQRLLL